MSTMIWGLSAGGLVSVLAGWVSYMATIPSGRVPKRPLGTFVLHALGSLLAALALVLAQREGMLGGGLIALSAQAWFLALFFFFLYTQRVVPAGDIQVQVGAPMLAFETRDSAGQAFHSDSLRGKRVLLKFFRGGW